MSTPLPPQLLPLMNDGFPSQRKFAYRRELWLRWLGEIPEVAEAFNSFPESLDRPAVAQLFTSLWPGNIPGAFAGMMVWGYAEDNRGPSRTLEILSQQADPLRAKVDPTVIERLRTSVGIVRSAGPGKAYAYLNNVPGKIPKFGPSFFTKWMYFASVTGPAGATSVAPILDALVIDWLSNQDPAITIRYGRTSDYRRYVELLSEWGKPYGLGPAQVEERIFRQIRNDGAIPADAERGVTL